jgi:hypothetical protein
MKAILLMAVCFLLFSFSTLAQNVYYDVGSRSAGMGNSNTTIADEWSIFNNVAGISGVENGMVFFGYNRFFEIDGFDNVSAGVIHPFKFGNVGFSLFRFGDNLYSEQIASAAFGNKIGFVRLGGRINYYQMRIDEFGTSGSLFFDIGGIVELIPKLSFGAFISNFTISKLNNSENTKMPVIMKVGLSYKPKRNVSLNMDILKDIDFESNVKLGIEYMIVDKVYLRTGLNANPFKGFFGAGILLDRFQLDYAIGTHQFLGSSHQCTVSYNYHIRNEN